MRSVVVVLPASIWAMMPMLRTLVRSVSTSRATSFFPVPTAATSRRIGEPRLAEADPTSPAVMREGPVGLRHSVRVFALLDAGAETVAGVKQLVRQALDHGLLATLPRVVHQPAQSQCGGTTRAHLDRDLVGRATDTAAADLEGRLHVVEPALKRHHGVGTGLLPAPFQSRVHDPL